VDGHIDWLSFTLDRKEPVVSVMQLDHEARELLRRVSDEHKAYIYNGQGFERCGGRAPYSFALARADGGVRVFGGGAQTGVLYELSGRACEGLRTADAASRFLAPIVERITRMDYAVDIRCNSRPSVFANARAHGGFRSISFIQSATGETVYVGSPKSDRFCRVYRYNSPHPRSALLRVEFVFRRRLAKDAARALLNAPNEPFFVAQLGNTYGWNHPEWKPGEKTDERVKAAILTRADEDTIAWLYKQVAPAIRRLLAQDAIDLADFLEHVYSAGKND